MKAIVESFERSDILVAQAKVSLHATGFATQLFKLEGQYECLKLIETMESAKYTYTVIVINLRPPQKIRN